jgi:GntR family transcriptional regulator
MDARARSMQEFVGRGRHRTSAVLRVRELLRVEILQQLRRGDLLPSEWELETMFAASRGVVRAALDLLRGEGLIARLQGAGTFVVSPALRTFSIDELGAMTRSLDWSDPDAGWELLEHEVVKAPHLIAERLHIPEGAEVTFFERRKVVDGEPLVLRSSWLPRHVADLLAANPANEWASPDELLELAIGHEIDCTHLRVEATIVDSSTADALGLPVGSPLVLLERLFVDVGGEPVEYGHSRVRADRVALTTVMHRPARAANRSTALAIAGDLDDGTWAATEADAASGAGPHPQNGHAVPSSAIDPRHKRGA